VPDDTEGVLQDVHWSGGSIGYFPTYALGNLISAQIWDRVTTDLPDIYDGFEHGEFGPLRDWLRGHRPVAVPGLLYLHFSRFGRYLFAVGSNAEAARLSGVNIRAVTYTAYILSALCAAVVGIMLASRTGTGNATQANGWELQAIASSVIGGSSLFGAVGTIWGPLLGAFILATIRNGANLLNVNTVLTQVTTFGTALGTPQTILPPRVARLFLQVKF